MRMNSVSEFFKKYLPKSVPSKNIIRKVNETELEYMLSYIGVEPGNSNFLVHENDNFTVTFEKISIGNWLVKVQFKD